jgi:hypothetical protein
MRRARIGGDGLHQQMLLFLAELDAADHADADFFKGQAEFGAGGFRITGLESLGIDSVVNDVDGRCGTLQFEQARHFIGDGDEGVRELEKMGAEKVTNATEARAHFRVGMRHGDVAGAANAGAAGGVEA